MDNQSSLSNDNQTYWIAFRPSTIHGTGGFARRTIPPGTPVIEYLGERISKAQSHERCAAQNEYLFYLNSKEDLDGNVPHNLARLLNHSCQPNCESRLEQECIWIFARREIELGEEITVNYGFDLEDYRRYPCCCGSPGCVGYIVAEEFFAHVRQQQISFS